MRMALDEVRQADFPFGAVIVREGQVIARGRNLGRTNDDPTAHGEMVAIRRCLADHGSAALKGATLYTSGEPCVMCMGAIVWCRFGRLVFAASVRKDSLAATSALEIMIWFILLAICSTEAAKTSRPKRHQTIAPMHITHGSPDV